MGMFLFELTRFFFSILAHQEEIFQLKHIHNKTSIPNLPYLFPQEVEQNCTLQACYHVISCTHPFGQTVRSTHYFKVLGTGILWSELIIAAFWIPCKQWKPFLFQHVSCTSKIWGLFVLLTWQNFFSMINCLADTFLVCVDQFGKRFFAFAFLHFFQRLGT